MLKRTLIPVLGVALLAVACELPPTSASTATLANEDYALLVFGEAGAALENTMGPQASHRPFDGRTGRRALPDSLALTDAQRAAMDSIRLAFREAHAAELDSIRAIFEAARTARQEGATREEVLEILAQRRELMLALRPAVEELHEAMRAVLTDAQRAWLDANRPHHVPRMPHRRFGPR